MPRAFDDWWKQMKPAECDELREVFIECWDVAFRNGHNAATEGKRTPFTPRCYQGGEREGEPLDARVIRFVESLYDGDWTNCSESAAEEINDIVSRLDQANRLWVTG